MEDLLFIFDCYLQLTCLFTCGILAYWIVVNLQLQKRAREEYDFEIPYLRCLAVCMSQFAYYIPFLNIGRFFYLIISDYDERYINETLATIKNLD